MTAFVNLVARYNARQTSQSNMASAQQITVDMYGVIGRYPCTASQLASYLRDKDLKEITLNLSTTGGALSDAFSIYNILKNHPAHVTISIMGYALSAGSYILQAADTRMIASNGLVMIHRAQGWTAGDATDADTLAIALRKHEQALIAAYSDRMGQNADTIQKLLNAETWYTAQEAIDAGLADQLIGDVNIAPIDEAQQEIANQYKNSTRVSRAQYQHKMSGDITMTIKSITNSIITNTNNNPIHQLEQALILAQSGQVTDDDYEALAASVKDHIDQLNDALGSIYTAITPRYMS